MGIVLYSNIMEYNNLNCIKQLNNNYNSNLPEIPYNFIESLNKTNKIK